MQSIIYAQNIVADLQAAITAKGAADKIVLLTDERTHELCRPLLASMLDGVYEITIGHTDLHKNLDTLSQVWRGLQTAHATRHSLLINLGGGMPTDLGGFAAATFKRGIRFINIPTTLLAMVDAAVGGKTGINFGSLKNEIGCFSDAETVLISTDFLKTLDPENLRSGYAEMLKHALLSDHAMWQTHLAYNLAQPDWVQLQNMVRQSIDFKQRIVTEDPHERGLRKALNLGHTAGHALESLFMQQDRPVLHGYAVAWGLVVELFMSHALLKFPLETLRHAVSYILELYGRPVFSCQDYERLHELMLHDKKNKGTQINFTLLADVGEIRIDQNASLELVDEAFDFLREG